MNSLIEDEKTALSADSNEIPENDIQTDLKILQSKDTTEVSNQSSLEGKEINEEVNDGPKETEQIWNEVRNSSQPHSTHGSNGNNSEGTEHSQQVLGEYINVSSHDELLKLLDDYYERTSTRFVATCKSKGFGASSLDADVTTKRSICWKDIEVSGSTINNYCLPYDGIPRVIVGNCILACHQGSARDKAKNLNKKNKKHFSEQEVSPGKRNMEKPSKKCGCPAKIYIRQMIKYPEFKIPTDTHHRRRDTSIKLKKRLKEDRQSLTTEVVFSLRLPDVSEHLYHPIEKEEDMKREMVLKDLSVLAKNLGLNKFGSNAEIKNALKDYVLNDMFYKQAPPNLNRRRYFPSIQDIRCMINNIRQISRCSIEQEEHLLSMINKLKSSDENLNIYFNVSVQSSAEQTSDDEFFEPDVCEIPVKSTKKKKKPTVPKKTTEIRTYLLCFQTSLQQRLLKRSGNIAFLSEVIIQDTGIKKVIPFHVYNILVQTNVDFQTIGCIIVSREQDNGLINGMNILKDWNTYWRPKYFIVDCSDEIYKAVETVFPECQYFLAPQSCERKWKEFLSKPSNDLSDYSTEIMTFLKNMKYSYTEDSLSIAAALFEGSDAWQKSTVLRTWFQSTWLHIAKKWVFGYRPEDLIITNHIDMSIVDCLKNYEQLLLDFIGNKHCVANFLEKAVQSSVAEDYRRYIANSDENYHSCKTFLKTNPASQCFEGFPETLIPFVYDVGKLAEEHCFEISHNNLGLFTVKYDEEADPDINMESQEMKTGMSPDNGNVLIRRNNVNDRTAEHLQTGEFTVSFGDLENFPFCTCSFWQMYKLPCVHMFKIFIQVPGWKYDMLSPLYRSSNVLHPDHSYLNEVSCIKCEDKSSQTVPLNSNPQLFKSMKDVTVSAEIPHHCKELLFHLEKMAFVFHDKTFYKTLTEKLSSVKKEAEEILQQKNISSSMNLITGQPTHANANISKKNMRNSVSTVSPSATKLNISSIDINRLKSLKVISSHRRTENPINTEKISPVHITKSPRLQSVLKSIAEKNPNANIKVITSEAAEKLVNAGKEVIVLKETSTSSSSGKTKPEVTVNFTKTLTLQSASKEKTPLGKPLLNSGKTLPVMNVRQSTSKFPSGKPLQWMSYGTSLALTDSSKSETFGSVKEFLSSSVSKGIEDVTVLSILPKLPTKCSLEVSQAKTRCFSSNLLAVTEKSSTSLKPTEIDSLTEKSLENTKVLICTPVGNEKQEKKEELKSKLSHKRKCYDLRGSSAPYRKKTKVVETNAQQDCLNLTCKETMTCKKTSKFPTVGTTSKKKKRKNPRSAP